MPDHNPPPLNDQQRKAAAIIGLAELFNRQPTKALVKLYLMALEDLPVEALETAAKRATRERKRFPFPSELRELTGELPLETRAETAWSEVSAALSAHGYYHSVFFRDVVTTAAIRSLGGWIALSERDRDQWLRKDFITAYLRLCARPIGVDETLPLPGFLALHNGPLMDCDHATSVVTGQLPHVIGTKLLPLPHNRAATQMALAVATRRLVTGRLDEAAPPDYICDTCGRPERLPFDVGDECICGGRFVSLDMTGLGILPCYSQERGDEFAE